MKKKFCDHCLKEVNYQYKEEFVKETIHNITIKYLKKYYICLECGNQFYDDLLDYNVESANNELRGKNNLILKKEIEDILLKYNIGKKNLSTVLGLGEVTITRYLDGTNPTKENSELLKMILSNPNLYELYLITNKEKITEIAYKKSLGRTKQLQLCDEHSKLYHVALCIIDTLEEITPLALQKVLYFTKGFSKPILKEDIFNDSAEAWVHGPVYKEIYDCFSYYKYNNINYSNILKDYDYNLTEEEKQYIKEISLLFGCYNGSVLKEMSHLTEPWLKARSGLKEDESSNRFIEDKDMDDYFKKICKKYNIKNIKDISKYSNDLFKSAIDNLNLKK